MLQCVKQYSYIASVAKDGISLLIVFKDDPTIL